MSLVEEYYELNEAEEVNVAWKIIHILLYGCGAGFGLWCGFTLALLRQKFDDRCYLFTDVKASLKDDKIDPSSINWENDSWCDYYQFSMISSFIAGIIWGTLFLMCGNGGKSLTGLPQPWRIVLPSLLFNFIYFVMTLSTAVGIQQGTDCFCERPHFNTKISLKSSTGNCEPLKFLLKDVNTASVQTQIVVKTSWGCAFSWFVLFLLSFFRVTAVVDFHMYKICVFKIDDTIQNKREEVLRITNYEEPKKQIIGSDGERLSNSDDIELDLEAGAKKKAKAEKKSTRQQYFNISNRAPHKPNAIFYEIADIRTLNREKKGKKTFEALDEAFGKNQTNLGYGLRKSIKIQSNSDVSANSEIPTFLYKYSNDFYNDEDDEYEASSSSTPQKADFDEEWNESEPGREILVGQFDSNRFLRFKKRI